MHNFTQYKKLLDQYHELTEDQVAAYACYNWGYNDTQRVRAAHFEVRPLDFTVGDSALDRAKFKRQYRIRSETIFKIIENTIPEKDF